MVAPKPRLSMTGLADPPDGVEQRVVLHVAGADLEDVGVLRDDVDLVRLHDLGDDRQPGQLARLGEVAEPLDAQALEGVRAGARLERAAAQERRAGRRHRVGRLDGLLAALDRARPGHDRQRAVADERVADRDDGVLGVELAAGQLERPADGRHRLDAGQRLEAAHERLLPRPDLADDRDDDPLRAWVHVRLQALGEDQALDGVDLRLSLAPSMTMNIGLGSL